MLLICSSFVLTTTTTEPEKAFAATASRWEPGRIIDDRIFTDASAMSVGSIQSFLNTIGGSGSTCLKNYQTPEPLGNNNYGGNVSAAHAIWKAAQLYTINPQVLIVTLQKEQGLITTTNCSETKYRTAMGFGCPDTAPCDAQWFGLSKQLFQAARHFRGYFDDTLTFVPFTLGNYSIGYHPNAACGGTTVNIQTRGTAALYSYTPYQPNGQALSNLYGSGGTCSSYGNRNFWRDFTDWFGSPTGDLVRTINNGTMYLVSEGKKYPIPNQSIKNDFERLGPLNYVSDTYVNALSTDSTLKRMVGSTSGSSLYLVNAGIKLPFTSCNSVADYGFSCAAILRLTGSQVSILSNGPPVTQLIKSGANNSIYYMEDGKKRPVSSWNDVKGMGVSLAINKLSDYIINGYPTGDIVLAGGSLLKKSGSATVYAVNNWSSSPSVFPVSNLNYARELGLSTSIRTVSNSEFSAYSVDATLGNKFSCSSTYYIGSNGISHSIHVDLLDDYGLSDTNFLAGGEICRNLPKSSQPFDRYIKVNNSIYFIENGTKRPFTSYGAYVNHGGTAANTVVVTDFFAATIATGSNLSS